MGLHVLLHVGLLGKGSATHNALEGLLTCVTEGGGSRSAAGAERRQPPGRARCGGGCQRIALGTWFGRYTWACQTRALRPESPEEVDCERPGKTRLVHRQNTCGLGMTGHQRKKQERKTALQQHQGIHCQSLCTDLGDLSTFSRV